MAYCNADTVSFWRAALGASPSVDFSSLFPDTGLYWYLNALAFTRFMPYYRVFMFALPLVYPVPVALRLSFDPFAAVCVLIGLLGVFDASSGNAAMLVPVAASALLADGRVFDEMRNVYLWSGLHVLACISLVGMKHAWLVGRTGNANLMFNMQLGYAVASGSFFINAASAALRLRKQQRQLVTQGVRAGGDSNARAHTAADPT